MAHSLEAAISRSATDDLPEIYYAFLPELREQAWFPEPRSDCSDCVMAADRTGEDPRFPWAFDREVRCCSFNPRMPNYALGRILRRRGPGAARIMQRLRDPEGVSAWGIHAQPAWQAAYGNLGTRQFGRNRSLRCPYWVGGQDACGVWHDRPAVCRTWFCKREHGDEGAKDWTALMFALDWMEQRLGHLLVKLSQTPEPGDPPARWAGWYVWCAGRIDRLTPRDVHALYDDSLLEVRKDLRERYERVPVPLPEVVIASVNGIWHRGERVRLAGYSLYDAVELPVTIFQFLSKLDGAKPWREALAETASELAEPPTEADVRELARCGLLRSPEPGDDPANEPRSPLEIRPDLIELYPELRAEAEAELARTRAEEDSS